MPKLNRIQKLYIENISTICEYTDNAWNNYESRARRNDPKWKVRNLCPKMERDMKYFIDSRVYEKKCKNHIDGFWRPALDMTVHKVLHRVYFYMPGRFCTCKEFLKNGKDCIHLHTRLLCRLIMNKYTGESGLGNLVFEYLY